MGGGHRPLQRGRTGYESFRPPRHGQADGAGPRRLEPQDRIDELAKELQNLYPKGKKPGTNNYWRGNFPEIRDRLINFFKKVGDYPNDVVIQATKNYIDSFQGDTRLMKTLKYFISKKRMDGNIEYDLLTFIENMDSKDEDGTLKTTRLI